MSSEHWNNRSLVTPRPSGAASRLIVKESREIFFPPQRRYMACILKSCLWRLDSSCKNEQGEQEKTFSDCRAGTLRARPTHTIEWNQGLPPYRSRGGALRA